MANIEPTLEYLVKLVFDDNYNYFDALKAIDYKSIDITTILTKLMDYENSIVYQLVKEAFDKKNVPYVETELKAHCTVIHKYAISLFMQNSFDSVNDVATVIYNSNLIASNHSLDGFNLMLNHYIQNNK